MTILLTDFEAGNRFKGDAKRALDEARDRLEALQKQAVAHQQAVMIVIEGWSQSGTSQITRALSAAFDPLATRFMGLPIDEDGAHFLKPFWPATPGAGETSVFCTSWYNLAFNSHANTPGLARMLDEINEFEAMHCDHRVVLIKLFLHISEATQRSRLASQIESEVATLSETDLDELVWRERRYEAAERALKLTNTHWAPWTIIDANDDHAGLPQALRVVADRLEASLPSTPVDRDLAIVERIKEVLSADAVIDSE